MTERAELTIERLSKLGDGVASHEGRTVFVAGALPGERIAASVEKQGGVLRGELLEILEPSPSRRAPMCPLADRCGGCDWMHLDEALQRDAKREIVASALEHVGRFAPGELDVRPAIAAGGAMAYRRRAAMHPAKGALAFFGRRSHERIPVGRCPALVAALEGIPGELAKRIPSILADAEEVQLLSVGGKVAFSAQLRGRVKESHEKSAERAIRELGISGAVLEPKEGAARLVGDPVLRGPAPLADGVALYFRPDGFTQANEAANAELVRIAIELLSAGPGDRVLELYSGNGNFTFAAARRAQAVVAVESHPTSLELARRSARGAKVENVHFIQGDAEKVASGLAGEGQRFDLLLLDPPRTGAKGCAEWARRLEVRRVVYVACDPAALARDARALADAGFGPEAVQVLDMFPQTRHVEAVMAFSRR